MKQTKRQKALAGLVTQNKSYPVAEALDLVKKAAKAKFDESVDVAVNLGIDAKKSDQLVRGSVVLPAGTGKKVRVAVFTGGAKAEEAKAAGADIVGLEDLAAKVKAGRSTSTWRSPAPTRCAWSASSARSSARAG
jgi:large subunit ribosomal protein L1